MILEQLTITQSKHNAPNKYTLIIMVPCTIIPSNINNFKVHINSTLNKKKFNLQGLNS